MSDDQQQQQQHKSSKDHTSTATTTTNANTTPPRHKPNIHEMRNQDYVSRLMAATPPYLYSAPVGPNNFFFSDMLRSLVQARNNENARNLQLQQTAALTRRPRKRHAAWTTQQPQQQQQQQHRPAAAYYDHLRSAAERKEHIADEKPQLLGHQIGAPAAVGLPPACGGGVAEKPLELTTNNKPYFHIAAQKYRSKLEESVKEELLLAAKLPLGDCAKSTEFETAVGNGGMQAAHATTAVNDALQDSTPPAASLPPHDLVLPPPPPVWYPPLYPPYGIDPLHFFIDLRVSGHIYDRKKENVSPLSNAENSGGGGNDNDTEPTQPLSLLPNKHRHGSAFTVPVPRSNEIKSSSSADAINLTASAGSGGSNSGSVSKFVDYAKYYDLGQEAKENQPSTTNQLAKCSANYMLQHLPRLYSQFAARDLITASNVAAVAAAAAVDEIDAGHNRFTADNTDTKSEDPDDADSDGRGSSAPPECGGSGDFVVHRERDIDVEIIDCIKYRMDGESSSRCTMSPDEASITQID